MHRFATILIALAILTGCAMPKNRYEKAQDERAQQLKSAENASLDLVKLFSKDTLDYFNKNGEQNTISAGENAVKNILKDPDSAKFQNVRISSFDGGKIICGSVNSKNSYGGYAGYQRFVASPIIAVLFDTDSRLGEDARRSINYGLIAACGE